MTALIVAPTFDDIMRLMTEVDDVTIGLAGPPGVGKTSLAFRIGEALGIREVTYKIQFHNELSPAEIMGMHVPDQTGFRWESGPGDLAYANGGMLILDELDQASGPTKSQLYSLLDRGPGGTFTYVGRTFSQAEGYIPIATMNDDPTNGSLPEALLDRFDAWFIITEPSTELLDMLDEDLRAPCLACYKGAKNPMAGPAFTYRMFLGIQKLRQVLPLDQAFLAACYGNQTQARSMYEAFILSGEEDD